jgi:hypothetical protein
VFLPELQTYACISKKLGGSGDGSKEPYNYLLKIKSRSLSLKKQEEPEVERKVCTIDQYKAMGDSRDGILAVTRSVEITVRVVFAEDK